MNKIFGVSGRILFNSSVLRVDSIKKGNLWNQDDLFFGKIKSDTIIFAITKERGDNTFSGSGEILRIFFSKNNSGNSAIKPFKIIITDSEGIFLPSPRIKESKIKVK